MHRSGTSLCSHLLSALGIDMTDKVPGPGATSPTPDNPRGHWERWEIVEFHDRILGLFNRDYSGYFHDFPLPVAWWADPRVAQIRREIAAFLESRMDTRYFGFKDPRTVRLMPVWHQLFTELELAPKLVLCLRNPAQVARSLYARDGLDREIGEYRWLIHMIDFFRYTNNLEFCTIEFEEWFNNPSSNIEKLTQFLDLQWRQSKSDLDLMLAGIIDPRARHDDTECREVGQPLVRSLYSLAGQAGQDGKVHEQIASIVSEFVSFQQLQRPFQRTFEDVAKIAARYPEIEQEVAAGRAAVSQRDAVVAALQAEVMTLREALAQVERAGQERANAAAALNAEVMTLREALAQVERAGQERANAAAALNAEVMTLREALAQAERAGQERANAAAALNAEVVTLREALAHAERAGQERADAAAALNAEVMTLREALAHVERARQERTEEAAALNAEVVTLREALAHAERAHSTAAAELATEATNLQEALAQAERAHSTAAAELAAEATKLREALAHAERTGQERADAAAALNAKVMMLRNALANAKQEGVVAAKALQDEIVALQGTLTAARQLGKAAIAALRIDTAALAKPNGPRGWRRTVMRFFGAQTSF
jgi:septal ring factor EnvC (AmiA/AmiB activator)